MLAIEVELLAGRYAATSHNDRNAAEWPPHPARFFSALVAALHGEQPVDPAEREALLWLEQQPPPSLRAELAGRRRVLDVYVPVNDITLVGDLEAPLREAREALDAIGRSPKDAGTAKEVKAAQKAIEKAEKKVAAILADQQLVDEKPSASALDAAEKLMPDRRTRQMRTFPVVFPEQPFFALIWPDAAPLALTAALSRLCDRVTRLGHSSSLVRCSIAGRDITPNLVPHEEGDVVLRVVGAGQLQRLEQAFARHQGIESRVLPAIPKRYGAPRKPAQKPFPRSVFSDEWILFERVDGARPLSSRATDLTRALRRALIEVHGEKTLPPALSGHGGGGGAADVPHIAFLALPYVAGKYADGSVQGCAIVLPRGLATADREALLQLVAKWERDRSAGEGAVMALAGGTLPETRFRRVEMSLKQALQTTTWCEPHSRFVTATPIALDRNPGDLRSNKDGAAHRATIEAQRLIAEACERIGLPRPISVEVSFAPLLQGAQPAHAFLAWPGMPGRAQRVLVHADITFGEKVRGPVLLGAGRYFGLGLCRPIQERKTS